MARKYDDSDLEDIEIINLADNLSPVPYSKVAPREYRKLHDLHNRVQPEKASQRLTQNPKFSYASGISPDLPFLRNGQGSTSKPSGEVEDEREDIEFPSPSALLHGHNQKDLFDVVSDDDDPFADDPVTPSDSIPAAVRNPGTIANSPSSYRDPSLDATALLSLSDPISAKPSTPKVASSFYNDMFDFAAFEDNVDIVSDAVPSSTPTNQSQLQEQASSSGPGTKRTHSASPGPENVKHRRLSHTAVADGAAAAPSASALPAWVNDFDASLVDGLKDFVDFID